MYLLYDCFANPSPFKIASESVLKHLNIPYKVLSGSEKFKYHGGYYGRIGKIEPFVFANVYNIWLAAKDNSILLTLEEDSYANIICAISFIYNNEAIYDFIVKETKANNMQLDFSNLHKHIAYFPSLLSNHIDNLGEHIKLRFISGSDIDSQVGLRNVYSVSNVGNMPRISANQLYGVSGFSTCLYYSNRHYDCNLNCEYDCLSRIFSDIGLQAFEMPFSMQSYTHFLPYNESMAYQKSGEIMYAGIDLGIDFLCVFSQSSYNIFDKQFKLCAKYCKRDKIEIPSLNLAQLLLICMDKSQDAGFDLHTIKPNFVLGVVKAS